MLEEGPAQTSEDLYIEAEVLVEYIRTRGLQLLIKRLATPPVFQAAVGVSESSQRGVCVREQM